MGNTIGSKCRLGEGLSSEGDAQEAEAQISRYPLQTPGNCPVVSLISATQCPVLNSLRGVLGEWL